MTHGGQFFVPGPMPNLNDMIAAAKVSGKSKGEYGKRWNAYAAMKATWEETVCWSIMSARVQPVSIAHLDFVWREPDMRRDPDNIAAAKKFVLDALVTRRVLQSDRMAHVAGWTDRFVIDKREPGVLVTIREAE